MKVYFRKFITTMSGDPVRDVGMEVVMLREGAKILETDPSQISVEAAAKALDGAKWTLEKIIKRQGAELTTGAFFANLLIGARTEADEKDLDVKEIIQRRRLADRIYGALEPISVTSEEIVLLRKLVMKAYNTKRSTILFASSALLSLEEAEKNGDEDKKKSPTPSVPKGGNKGN